MKSSRAFKMAQRPDGPIAQLLEWNGNHRNDSMPLYEYECQKCHHRFERIQKFSDAPMKKCPDCGGTVEQLISAPAVQFKGSGWYVTDYAKKGSGSGSSESSVKSESKGDAKADSKSDSSSETKSESKSDSKPAKKESKASKEK